MVEAAATSVPNGTQSTPTSPTVDPSKTSGSRLVGAPFRISTMQERDKWLKMLVYGIHGAGKTELTATAVDVPQMGDVLMVDAESGDKTLDDSPRIEHAQDIKHVRVKTFMEVAYVQEFLKAYCAARDRGDTKTMSALYARVSGIETDNPPKFRTVIIDSLTEVEVYCQYQILKINPEGNAKDIGDDIDVAGWPEFRKNLEMVKLLVRAFRDLPMHVLFTCAQSYTQDEIKRNHYSPSLTGKLGTQVQGFVDIVGWLTVGSSDGSNEAPRRMFVQPITGGPRFDAKNRFSVYKAPFFDDPSMKSIMEGIKLLK